MQNCAFNALKDLIVDLNGMLGVGEKRGGNGRGDGGVHCAVWKKTRLVSK